jgi:hypothetical protein
VDVYLNEVVVDEGKSSFVHAVAHGDSSVWTKSRFEQICDCDSPVVSKSTERLLAVLLSSAGLCIETGRRTLEPLWAMEAIHRSLNFVKLSLIRQRRGTALPDEHPATTSALTLATHLAGHYKSIADVSERQIVSCSPVVRLVVTDLIALFGPDSGTVEVETDIKCISLPAFQRRALILSASDLVMNSPLLPFNEGELARLTVELHVVGPDLACLTVGDDRNLPIDWFVSYDGGTADDMAGLLAPSVVRQHSGPCGTVATITFHWTSDDPGDGLGVAPLCGAG